MTADARPLTVLHPTQETRTVLAVTSVSSLLLVLQEVHDRTFGHILRHDVGILCTGDDPELPLGVVMNRFGSESRDAAYNDFIAVARGEVAKGVTAESREVSVLNRPVEIPLLPGVVHLQVSGPCLLHVFPEAAWSALPAEVRERIRPLTVPVEGLGYVATGPIDTGCRCNQQRCTDR